MTVYCSLCGREFDADPAQDCGLAWCECAGGIVETDATKPERHR
jgi:hypothetical protein